MSGTRILLLVLFSVVLAGCRRSPGLAGGAPAAREGGVESAAVAFRGGSLAAAAPSQSAEAGTVVPTGKTDPAADPDPGRKRIRNAEISIEVRDFGPAARRVERIASSFGGYVAESQVSGEDARRSGTLTIRVRADAFDAALEQMRTLGKVQEERVSTQDVTKAYTDLEARLSVKREAADRIRAILRDRTARLADVLQAEKQLSEFVEQIEVMEGEKRFYDRQIALSTISAEVHEAQAVTRSSALAPLKQALHDSFMHLCASAASLVTGALYALPWALAAAAIYALARRLRRARKAAPAA